MKNHAKLSLCRRALRRADDRVSQLARLAGDLQSCRRHCLPTRKLSTNSEEKDVQDRWTIAICQKAFRSPRRNYRRTKIF